MPKPPKKAPAWMKPLCDFIKTKERNHEIKEAVDSFSAMMTKHWAAFVETKSEEKKSDTSAKRKKPDPVKNMSKAMSQVAEELSLSKDNPEAMSQYKEKVRTAVPNEFKPVLRDAVDMSYDRETILRFIKDVDEKTEECVDLTLSVKDVISDTDPNIQKSLEKTASALTDIKRIIQDFNETL